MNIVAAAPERQPFPIDARVEEEDTYLVLSAAAVLSEPSAHPLRVLHEAHSAQPHPPGAVLVRAGVPLRLLAVTWSL